MDRGLKYHMGIISVPQYFCKEKTLCDDFCLFEKYREVWIMKVIPDHRNEIAKPRSRFGHRFVFRIYAYESVVKKQESKPWLWIHNF